jgi:hypothetical protein
VASLVRPVEKPGFGAPIDRAQALCRNLQSGYPTGFKRLAHSGLRESMTTREVLISSASFG